MIPRTKDSGALPHGKVIVEYWADWCQPCKLLTPIVEELEKEMSDITFFSVDSKAELDFVRTQNVQALPTIQIFKDGVLQNTLLGALPKDKLKEQILEAFK